MPTVYGAAQYVLDLPDRPAPVLLVLGHGAGGGIDAPDLLAVRDHALAAGVAVARVTQPYRVAGRRAPAPAGHLDAAWLAVVAVVSGLREYQVLIVGGRSSGARVACRTAAGAGAAGVVALAFPTHPPGRPEVSRAEELNTGVPALVVNGGRDVFGLPPPLDGVRRVVLPGETHALSRDPGAVGAAVVHWLADHGWTAAAWSPAQTELGPPATG